MDLFSIAQTVWRHKLATVPVIMLTFVLAVYVVALKSPVYQTSASYILIAPPAPPSAQQLARDPALAKVNNDNPFVRFGDMDVVDTLLTQTVSTDAVQQEMIKAGADPRTTVTSNTIYGSAPLVDITGVGSSPAAAIQSAKVAGRILNQTLANMQAAKGVNSTYWFTTQAVQVPDAAKKQVSSTLRSLVGVLAAGVILLFIVVSTMRGLAERRKERTDSQLADADWSLDAERGLEERPRANGDHEPTYGGVSLSRSFPSRGGADRFAGERRLSSMEHRK